MTAVQTAVDFTLAILQVLRLVCRQADRGGSIEAPSKSWRCTAAR
jgi:hypothetical protein